MKSKALEKSKNKMRVKLSEFSDALNHSSVNFINAWVVDLLAVQLKWFVSKRGAKCSLKNRPISNSATLAIVFVIAIGLISFSTVLTGKNLGKGVNLDIFHWSGTIPWWKDEFTIAQIGAASVYMKSVLQFCLVCNQDQ